MTRQQYRKALREIDKKLKMLDQEQERWMIRRGRAKDKKFLEIVESSLQAISTRAMSLFEQRRKLVEYKLGEESKILTSHPSEQQEDTPVYPLDGQKT